MTTAAARPRRRARRGEGELLRAEILTAARELLAETQDADAVSVRSVAERVGVSTPSLYLHFADKQALLDAVCELVFADLDERMQAAAATTDDPFDGLRLRGLAYAEFALANPEQYRLAMMRMPAVHEGFDKNAYSPFSAEDIVAGPTYHHLIEAVQRCIEVGVFAPGTDPNTVATSLWAATHGAVSLCLAKPGLAGPDALALCEMVIENAGLGSALSSYLSHPHDGDEHTHEGVSENLATLLRATAQIAATTPPTA
ncbi:MAG: TetR/AcrR family transcriptional regulator [Candidatus Nanopelagicales bacterium]